jgi:hypothetical protein
MNDTTKAEWDLSAAGSFLCGDVQGKRHSVFIDRQVNLAALPALESCAVLDVAVPGDLY